MPRICRRCKVEKAEIYLSYSREYLCLDCFNRFFEKRVADTIERYKMFRAGDYIGVGVSGGKDSAALLYVLKKLYPNKEFVAIHLNHGIGEYSRDSLDRARELAESVGVDIHVFDYVSRLGISIPDVELTKYRNKVCSVCGYIRRWALWKAASELGVDILATGHNLDDTVEVMLNQFITGNFEELTRLRPVLPPEVPGQVWKVKPLIRSPERDNFYYAMFNDLPVKRIDCPYYVDARSTRRKRLLDMWERESPNIKFQLYSVFTKKLIPLIEARYGAGVATNRCRVCGGPSYGDVCGACRRIELVREAKGL